MKTFYLQHLNLFFWRGFMLLQVLIEIHMCIRIGGETVVVGIVVQNLQGTIMIVVEFLHLQLSHVKHGLIIQMSS